MFELIRDVGWRTVENVHGLGGITRFGSRLVLETLAPPYRLRRVLDELYNTGVLSLAIVCASGTAVGLVLGLQGYNTLVRFGAEQSVGAVVGLSLVRELGPVLTALLVTGRAGSAVAAEIGAMVATEQLDGLRMMSVDPIDFVTQPKALALALAMPLLSALFIVFGLFGGYLVAVGLLGVDAGTYVSSLENNIDFRNDVLGSILKSLVFGALVGLVATWRGYTSAPNAAGVSRATTGAVVQASVATLMFDYVITALWGVGV
ncbi:MAG TPA: MlaE family lipid ABC transporter permease subunit [Myxococcota bacterium]|nr:MlaE family lipid ABC transporter permease subunit [Myxococcota bacterium]